MALGQQSHAYLDHEYFTVFHLIIYTVGFF